MKAHNRASIALFILILIGIAAIYLYMQYITQNRYAACLDVFTVLQCDFLVGP